MTTVGIELKPPPLKVQKPRFGEGGFYSCQESSSNFDRGVFNFARIWAQICQNFPAALRAAGTKTSRFPLKETVFAVKNTPNFRGASRRFDRGVFIRSKDLAQILVGGFLFLPEISGKVTGGFLRRGGFLILSPRYYILSFEACKLVLQGNSTFTMISSNTQWRVTISLDFRV